MPYCLYLRKSRADAEAEAQGAGETLARHEAALLELAKRQKLNVTEIYKEIVSGETIAARPVMQKLLNEVGQGLWDGVLVMEIERLARGDNIDQGLVAQAFKFTDTKIITPAKTYDPNNEFDEEYFEFGLFMSRREYKTIRRRMARGREAAVKEGKYIGTYPPYGYKKIQKGKDCTLEINPEQAETVRLIYELYTSNTNRLGYNSIAERLNAMNVPSMRNKLWLASTIKTILKNPIYIGKVRWHYKKEVKKIIDGEIKITTTTSDEGEYILSDGIHEPIIDREIWEKAQIYIKQIPTSPAPISRGIKNPFAGLIICGVCGKKMVRKPYINKPASLYCYNKNCYNKSAYFSQVEREIIVSLQNWLQEYKIQNNIQASKNKNNFKSSISIKEKQLERLSKEKSTIDKQLENAYNFLEKGIYNTDEFLERSATLKNNISDLEKSIKEIEREINIENNNIINQDNFIPKVESVLQAYDKITDCGEKNKLLRQILSKIIYVREKRNYKNGIDNRFEIKIFPKIQ